MRVLFYYRGESGEGWVRKHFKSEKINNLLNPKTPTDFLAWTWKEKTRINTYKYKVQPIILYLQMPQILTSRNLRYYVGLPYQNHIWFWGCEKNSFALWATSASTIASRTMSDPFTSAVNTIIICFIWDVVKKKNRIPSIPQSWTDKTKSYQAFIKKKREKNKFTAFTMK